VQTGDRVTAMSGRGCGQCHFCQDDDIVHCSKLSLLGYGVQGLSLNMYHTLFELGIYSLTS
jgi:D-arabinose 1-dehydrogenase-like Zn-dependent alcohol dehydrogenase